MISAHDIRTGVILVTDDDMIILTSNEIDSDGDIYGFSVDEECTKYIRFHSIKHGYVAGDSVKLGRILFDKLDKG